MNGLGLSAVRLDSFWAGAVVLAALTFICYAGALDNSFHYDDSHSIIENRHIRQWSAIPSFFVDSSTFSNEASMAMYRPLLQASYTINYTVGRYDVVGYRLVNLIAHALCAVIVFAFARRLSGSNFLAWAIGALFALHPLNSQVVNYISSRSELMYVLGVLGALYLHRFRDQRRLARVLYVLALLCKSAAVVLLPLVVLLEATRGSDLKRIVQHAMPYGVLTAAYVLIIAMDGFLPRSLGQDVRPLDVQLYTQMKALVFYLKLIAMPIGLSAEHAFTEATSLADGTVLASGLLVATVLIVTIRSGGALPWARLGAHWFFAGLLLTFVIPLNVLVNEHRLYLPAIGVLLVLATALGRRKMSTRVHRPARGVCALAVALLLICAVHTQARNAVWLDEYSLWKDAATKAPGMFRAQSNLGLALYERGELVSARQAFERSIQINPHYGKSWSNLGLVYEDLGMLAPAERAFEQARRLSPELSGSYNNLGRLYTRLGRDDEAEPLLETAVRQDPHNVQAWVNLGRAYQRQDRLPEAEEAYRRAANLDPTEAQAFNNLGLLLGELGRRSEARQMLHKAIAIDPSYVDAAVNLKLHELKDQGFATAMAYRLVLNEYPHQVQLWKALAESELRSSNWADAAVAYETVLKYHRGDVGAHMNLASAYRGAGQLSLAIASYEEALRLDPRSTRIHNNLASAHAAAGDLASALRFTRAALEINPADNRTRANLEKLEEALSTPENGSQQTATESP